jgi:hypothetical protein
MSIVETKIIQPTIMRYIARERISICPSARSAKVRKKMGTPMRVACFRVRKRCHGSRLVIFASLTYVTNAG